MSIIRPGPSWGKETPPECAHIDKWVTVAGHRIMSSQGYAYWNPEYERCVAEHGPKREPYGPRFPETTTWIPTAEVEQAERDREKLIVAGVVVVSLLILAWR